MELKIKNKFLNIYNYILFKVLKFYEESKKQQLTISHFLTKFINKNDKNY